MGLKAASQLSLICRYVKLKSDQDGIESRYASLRRLYGMLLLKSDQDGIERSLPKVVIVRILKLKSDQDGIESTLCYYDNTIFKCLC